MIKARALAVFGAALCLAGCQRVPPIAPPADGPPFDALAFFSGKSRGKAELRKAFSKPVPVAVRSVGRVVGGELTLNQEIREGSKPPRIRQWQIHATAPDRYAGTLTDAIGPISGESEGNRLHLSFTMKGGFPTEQWLSLAADGRSAHNILIVRKFGLTIAVLEETIRRD